MSNSNEEKNMSADKAQFVIDPALENGVYCNTLSVLFQKYEGIFDFGFFLPQTNPPILNVRARVVLPLEVVKSLYNVLGQQLKIIEEKALKGLPDENKTEPAKDIEER